MWNCFAQKNFPVTTTGIFLSKNFFQDVAGIRQQYAD